MVDFLPVSLTARPARVALAVPDGSIAAGAEASPWQERCLGAIAHLGRIWGGAGMVLVPIGASGIADPILRFLSAYDPDFVVPYQHDAGLMDRRWIPRAARDQLSHHLSAPDPYEVGAQPTLAARQGDPQYPLTPVSVFSTSLDRPACLEVDGNEDLALLVSARVGALNDYDKRTYAERGESIESATVGTEESFALLSLAYGGRQLLPTQTGRWNSADFQMRLPFPRTLHGCSELARGATERSTTVVVGDAFADYALALLIDRVCGSGSGLWLPNPFSTMMTHAEQQRSHR